MNGSKGCMHTCTVEYYSTMKKCENLPFGVTWVHFEGIKISEIFSWRKTSTVWFHSYVESEKTKQINRTIQKWSCRYREQIDDYLRGKELGSGPNGWRESPVWWWMGARLLVVITLLCMQIWDYNVVHLTLIMLYTSFTTT